MLRNNQAYNDKPPYKGMYGMIHMWTNEMVKLQMDTT